MKWHINLWENVNRWTYFTSPSSDDQLFWRRSLECVQKLGLHTNAIHTSTIHYSASLTLKSPLYLTFLSSVSLLALCHLTYSPSLYRFHPKLLLFSCDSFPWTAGSGYKVLQIKLDTETTAKVCKGKWVHILFWTHRHRKLLFFANIMISAALRVDMQWWNDESDVHEDSRCLFKDEYTSAKRAQLNTKAPTAFPVTAKRICITVKSIKITFIMIRVCHHKHSSFLSIPSSSLVLIYRLHEWRGGCW